MSVFEGLRQAGSYQINRLLSSNGAAATFLAADINHNANACVVAIDRSLLYDDPDPWPPFQENLNALVSTPLRGIVRPLQCGEENGVIWAAYEYHEGHHLGEHVRDQGLPPVTEALGIIRDAVMSVNALHNRGMTHLMLGPSSIFLPKSGKALIHHAVWSHMLLNVRVEEALDRFVSTLPFLAPEVAGGTGGDTPADVYCLGANLYFLLCGQPPHWADDVNTLRDMVAAGEVDMTPVREAVSEPVAELVEELLEKDPEDRPLNLEALQERLAALRDEFASGAAPAAGPHDEETIRVDPPAVAPPEEQPPSGVDPGHQQETPQAPPASEELETDRPGEPRGAVPGGEPPPMPPAGGGPGATDNPDYHPEPEHPDPRQLTDGVAVQADPEIAQKQPPRVGPADAQGTPKTTLKKDPKAGKKLVVIGIVAVLLLIGAAGIGFVFTRGFQNSNAEETAAAAAASEAEAAREQARLQEEISDTFANLEALGQVQQRHLQEYGIWASTPQALLDEGASDPMLNDAWGTPIDLREQYLVSAGPDGEWETDDEVWLNVETGERGS